MIIFAIHDILIIVCLIIMCSHINYIYTRLDRINIQYSELKNEFKKYEKNSIGLRL